MGTDRDEAIEAMDDDEEFDRWMTHYQRKTQMKHQGGGTRLSNETYLARHAKVHGGDDD
jgi:hypothetical protein